MEIKIAMTSHLLPSEVCVPFLVSTLFLICCSSRVGTRAGGIDRSGDMALTQRGTESNTVWPWGKGHFQQG